MLLCLRFEDLNNVAFNIADWTSLEISAAGKAAYLMPARSNDRIDGIIIAKNTLQQKANGQHVSERVMNTGSAHQEN